MRTTLNLDDHLLRAAKERAAREGTTLTATLEAALREFLRPRRRGKGKTYRFDLPVWSCKPLPGVDLSDRDALYERMGGRG